MAKVTIRPDESLKDALRRFKKGCNKEGLINRMKRASTYEKPSERRARERAEAVRRLRKLERKRREREGF